MKQCTFSKRLARRLDYLVIIESLFASFWGGDQRKARMQPFGHSFIFGVLQEYAPPWWNALSGDCPNVLAKGCLCWRSVRSTMGVACMARQQFIKHASSTLLTLAQLTWPATPSWNLVVSACLYLRVRLWGYRFALSKLVGWHPTLCPTTFS